MKVLDSAHRFLGHLVLLLGSTLSELNYLNRTGLNVSQGCLGLQLFFMVFLINANNPGLFEDYARKMYAHYNHLNVPTWILH
jgi:hypothetical protein